MFAQQQQQEQLQEQEGKLNEEGQNWAQDFNDQLGGEGESFDNMDWQAALEKAKASMKPADPEYKFSPNNPFAEHKNPFEEGVKLMKLGHLKEAILAFEAEVQRHPDNAEAWRFIGEAQAENEEENNAIAALLKAVAIDPYNLKALMMLGVSYTNDLEESRALTYLKTWMIQHPDYANTVRQSESNGNSEYEELYGGTSSQSTLIHDEVTRMFLDAVKVNPRDPDLHTVLGVLYHISNDFDKAIESFKIALKLKPDDPCLWNKLGATQANSSRSSEAVHAYKRALELRPRYVRALANLAISFANQGLHDEACRAYLSTLKQNPDANHVWSYLRISLSHLDKQNLVELTQSKNVELFRPHFEF